MFLRVKWKRLDGGKPFHGDKVGVKELVTTNDGFWWVLVTGLKAKDEVGLSIRGGESITMLMVFASVRCC